MSIFKEKISLSTPITKHWKNWGTCTKTLNRLQMAKLEYNFQIQYKKGINMPANFLSKSFAETGQEVNHEVREDEDPDFGLYQKQHRELQLMTNYLKNRKWDINRLCYSHKLFQEGQIVWLRLNDHN